MKIALVGYGRMGHAVEAQARDREHEIVARLGRGELGGRARDLAEHLSDADVAIDFTVGELTPRVIEAAGLAGTDLVVGTTGFGDDAHEAMESAGGIGIVHGPNFSIGVHVFFRIAGQAARLIDGVGGYDTHVNEAHHRHKRDHPSGTAWRLADLLVERLGDKTQWRSGPPAEQPDPATLYVTSVRAGEIPGSHTVGFDGVHDRIEVTHEARGRDGFASGALRAAEWIHGRDGVFTFTEVIDRILDLDTDDADSGEERDE
ncbi:MAG: 4-hydroxy-tetrahydrodipicolinate reductase [Gemmatimonadota bacterium]|nr:4-hydroxy-tetrahydrodipicolinate reductase [Gemmatimonadota bacterium]